VPDSGAGVGFGDYDSYAAQRERELAGVPQEETTVQLPGDPLSGMPGEATQVASAGTDAGAGAPVVPTAPINNSGISDEQDFDAVSSRESIESDRERLAAQRAQYQEIAPKAVPTRSGEGGPNIVEYALTTTNLVGQSIYRRSNPLRNSAFLRNCSKYGSPDLAQEAFLKAGGPKKDRYSLDPDGDGFACYWDPAPFRLAVGR